MMQPTPAAQAVRSMWGVQARPRRVCAQGEHWEGQQLIRAHDRVQRGRWQLQHLIQALALCAGGALAMAATDPRRPRAAEARGRGDGGGRRGTGGGGRPSSQPPHLLSSLRRLHPSQEAPPLSGLFHAISPPPSGPLAPFRRQHPRVVRFALLGPLAPFQRDCILGTMRHLVLLQTVPPPLSGPAHTTRHVTSQTVPPPLADYSATSFLGHTT